MPGGPGGEGEEARAHRAAYICRKAAYYFLQVFGNGACPEQAWEWLVRVGIMSALAVAAPQR
jgi:hypothetical protein